MKELLDLLELNPEAFTATKLHNIEPDNWKNVGVSIVHAFKVLKENSVDTAENLT